MGVNSLRRSILTIASALILLQGNGAFANGESAESKGDEANKVCEDLVTAKEPDAKTNVAAAPNKPRAARAPSKKTKSVDVAASSSRSERSVLTLDHFFLEGERNLAVLHPFTVANAAEKAYALMTHTPSREAADPLYGMEKTVVYPMLAGEHPASEGHMVVGQERPIHQFVQFIGSIARGDRSGKATGFPGPPGTGKTELLYVYANIERNLGNEDKYKQYSYRFRGPELLKVPYLRNLFRFDRDGRPNLQFIDPDMPRSPFTLLRADMQKRVLAQVSPLIRSKWGVTISKGWTKPEPKSSGLLRAIFEHEFPAIAEGQMSVEDLTEREYLDVLNKYVVIVPKLLLQPKMEATILRAQTDNPNWQALFTTVNISRATFYGMASPLAIDYSGKVFKQDGGLLMIDEMYRNPPELLNILLEVVQNRMVETDYGDPVELDVVPVWNANDESIELAKQNSAIKASLDRAEKNPMRLLLPPTQIEGVSLFQVDAKRFKMRNYDSTEIVPLDYAKIYPAVNNMGKTETAYGRVALYYNDASTGRDILLSPMTLNYLSWLVAATRFVTEPSKILEKKDELNLVTANPSLFTDPILRLRIALGDRSVEMAEKMELSRLRHLLQEGQSGISSRDVETWLKTAINLAVEEKRAVITPRLLDIVFGQLLDAGTISPSNDQVRSQWQILRTRVKQEILLPRLENDVKAIISGDGQKAERVYDELEREFVELGQNPSSTHVTPDDGSQPIIINRKRLETVMQIYQRKFGRPFSPNFLLKHLRGARSGKGTRDGQLLDAIREMLADADSTTADYISAFDSLYRQKTNDPTVVEKAGQVETRLWQFGYDQASFKEAVSFVSQLRHERNDTRNRNE